MVKLLESRAMDIEQTSNGCSWGDCIKPAQVLLHHNGTWITDTPVPSGIPSAFFFAPDDVRVSSDRFRTLSSSQGGVLAYEVFPITPLTSLHDISP